MSPRQISTPPEIPGFSFVEVIGSGGYADVFLYEQAMPRRQVAVKVLDAALLPAGAVSDYTEEANVMAMVSAHPYIVQVFQADVSPDGRPYLVMEYYPGLNFQQRAKREEMDVAEVLRVGIQIACAVETAHEAGILHRDIKPANILTSEYRKPGLTDFGIAAVDGPDEITADGGLSIPWSSPESLYTATSNRRAEVYALAATIYTMLAGRSPFELIGGDNRHLSMMTRIEHDPVPPLGRADVSAKFERVLIAAMAKDPAHRPASAADLARQLQGVESDLNFPVTELELVGQGQQARQRTSLVDDDATTAKPIVQVEAQDAPVAERPAPAREVEKPTPSRPSGPVAPRRREGLLAEPEVERTLARATPDDVELDRYEAESEVSKTVLGAIAAAAILLVVVGAVFFTGGEDSTERNPSADVVDVNDNFGQEVGAPVAVTPNAVGQVDGQLLEGGSFEFSWADQGSGVSYAIRVGDATFTTEIDEPKFVASDSCIEVEVIAPSGLISAPTRGCVQE